MPKQNKSKNLKRTATGGKKRDPLVTRREMSVPKRVGVSSVVPFDGHTSSLAASFEGHVNPFSDAAAGTKVHDSNSAKTFSYRALSRSVIYCDGVNRFQGSVVKACLIEETTNYTTPAITTGPWTVGVGQQTSGYSAINGAASGYRIVSWGVRLFCSCPYNLADGYVIIATTRGGLVVPTNDNTNNPASWTSYEVIALKDLDHVWISERSDQILAEAYVDVNTVATTDSGWTSMVVQYVPSGGIDKLGIAGAAIQFEIIKNLEIEPKLGTIADGVATPAAPEDARINSIVNRVHASAGNFHPTETHKPTLLSHIGSALSALAGDAVGWALPRVSTRLFGGQKQYALRNAVDVD